VTGPAAAAPREGWAPDACTLPTAERPLRRAEFDSLLGTALRAQRRLEPTVLLWDLDPAVEAEARDLAARETECCSFFSFAFTPGADELRVEVRVPPAHVAVLDALAARGRPRPA
jgi:hypothetical protein